MVPTHTYLSLRSALLPLVLVALAGPLPAAGERETALPFALDPAMFEPPTHLQRAEDGTPLAVGAHVEARFGPEGARVTPVLGERAALRWDLHLRAVELERGGVARTLPTTDPILVGQRLVYPRAPGVEERFDAAPGGLMHSLWIEQPIGEAGDLVVRLALGGNLAPHGQLQADGTHRFDGGEGGLTYGNLTAFDAAGAEVAGDVRLVPGGMEWRVPAAFVDSATWPLLLDPLVGENTTIATPDVGDIDLAFDLSTQRYLVVWERRLSATDRVLRAHRTTATGAPVGGVLALSEVVTTRAPKVANVNASNRFAVVWTQVFFGESQVRMRLVDAATGVLSTTAFLQGEPEGSIQGADVVGEQIVGLTAQVWVVWDSSSGGIRGARVSVPSTGNPATLATFQVAADPGVLDRLTEPSLAAVPSGGGRIGVAWTRTQTINGSKRVFAATFDRSGNLVQGPSLVSPSGVLASMPAIDGGGGFNAERFVVAWSAEGPTSTQARSWRPTAAVPLSDVVTLSTSLAAAPPKVAWKSNGKAYVMHRSTFIEPLPGCSPTIASLRLTGLNAEDCSTCEPTFEVASGLAGLCGSGPTLGPAALALEAAYGDPTSAKGLVVKGIAFSGFDGLLLQPVAIDSPLASAVNQGGGCSATGPISAPTPPHLGNPNFRLRYDGAPGTALFAWLNLAVPQEGFQCGPCRWLPFATTFALPVSPAGSALVELPLPCVPALAGVQVDSQFTLLQPTASDCGLLPGFAVTDILRLTLQ